MKYNHYQFRDKSQFGIRYYYCYGTDDFEDYMKFKNIKYRKLPEDNSEGRNIINEQDKEIERLNNIINELDKFLKDKIDSWKKANDDEIVKDTIYHERLAVRLIYNYLQELKGSDK